MKSALLPLEDFIGKMPGIESITTERGIIEIRFDDSAIKEEDLLKITKDSIEKLGYKLVD